jgi:pilus assembly protein Flp/PilA
MRGERGASAVEYGVLLSLIAAVVIVAVGFLGRNTSSSFSCTGQAMGGVVACTASSPPPSHVCPPRNPHC